MSEKFFKNSFIPPEERNLQKLRGVNLREVIEFLEGQEIEDINDKNADFLDNHKGSIFIGFLDLLRKKGVRVSTSEWLQFLRVIKEKINLEDLKNFAKTNELFNKIRLFAQSTLVKNKSEEAAFHEAFDEYFELVFKIYDYELKKEIEKQRNNEKQKNNESKAKIKEKLGIQEVDENLNFMNNSEHSDNENIHGGNEDQHNDILKKEDLTKVGGGDRKDDKNNLKRDLEKKDDKIKNQLNKLDDNFKQKKIFKDTILESAKNIKSVLNQQEKHIVYHGKLTKQKIKSRKEKAKKIDKRKKYELRPNKASMREVIRNLRRIIMNVSEVKSSDLDLKTTVKNFARRDFRFNYQREKEKQSEVILLIDVGGPVDEWSPLIKDVVQEMSKGLSKLEVYLFHNNLYGYVWKPDKKNFLASSYARPNSLISLKKIIKKRKKVIIYGDAEMSYSEFEDDCWPPDGNQKRINEFGMSGDRTLEFIKKKANSVVWINPIFAKEWDKHDDSGTIQSISNIIPMYDLTVGGVEDAIKNLMKK